MQIIKQVYQIQAPLKEVWRAFTDPDIITKWGGGPAIMDEKVGTEFKLWDGDIWGTNIEVEQGRKLVQEWYGGSWDKPSVVTFLFSTKLNKTIIELTHTGVPESEIKSFEEGWEDHYIGPMKDFLEDEFGD